MFHLNIGCLPLTFIKIITNIGLSCQGWQQILGVTSAPLWPPLGGAPEKGAFPKEEKHNILESDLKCAYNSKLSPGTENGGAVLSELFWVGGGQRV